MRRWWAGDYIQKKWAPYLEKKSTHTQSTSSGGRPRKIRVLGKDPKLIRKPCPDPTPNPELAYLRCKSFPACMLGAIRLASLIYSCLLVSMARYKPKPSKSAIHAETSPSGMRSCQQRDDSSRLTRLSDCRLTPASSIPEQSHLPRTVPTAAGLLGELPTRQTGAGNAAPRASHSAVSQLGKMKLMSKALTSGPWCNQKQSPLNT